MTTDDGLPDFKTYTDRFQFERREEAQSDSAHALLPMLRQLDPSSLGREQLDLLDDLAATLMGLVNAELLRRDGWSFKPSWAPVETSPTGTLVPVDHAYRLVHEEDERWLYVSEPYPQTAETLSGLKALVAQGWHVDVRSGFALHYPGHTLRIQIERAGAISEPTDAITRGLPRPL